MRKYTPLEFEDITVFNISQRLIVHTRHVSHPKVDYRIIILLLDIIQDTIPYGLGDEVIEQTIEDLE